MALTGVIGTLIAFGILIFSVAKQVIITDHEYVLAERFYELEECARPILKPVIVETTTSTAPGMLMPSSTTRMEVAQPMPQESYVTPTEAEIAGCEAKKTQQLIASRYANFKIDILNGAIWSILFLILLFTHYPRFMKINNKE